MRRKLTFWIGGIVTSLVAGLSVVILTADEPFDVNDYLWSKGESSGRALTSAKEGVALTINGHPVTVGQFLTARVETEEAKEFTESVLSRVVPDDDPSLKQASMIILDMDSPLPEALVAPYRRNQILLETHSIDAITLGTLIADYAPYVLGVEAGLTMTDAEVQAEVENQRISYKSWKDEQVTASDDEGPIVTYVRGDPVTEAVIETVGDEFWTKHYPEQVRRQGVATKWRKQSIHDGMPIVEANKVLRKITKEAVLSVVVEITGEIEINATSEDAIAYYLDWDRLNNGESTQLDIDTPSSAVTTKD